MQVDAGGLVAEPSAEPVAHGVGIGGDGPGDHRLAEPERRFDDDLTSPGHRIDGEGHSRRVGRDHPLHHDGDRHLRFIDALLSAVGHGPFPPQRGPAAFHGGDHVVADDPEHGLLLSGEGGLRQILRSGGGTHRDGAAESRRRRQDLARQGFGYGAVRSGAVGVCGDAEAIRHRETRSEQFSQVGSLAADQGEIVLVDTVQVNDHGATFRVRNSPVRAVAVRVRKSPVRAAPVMSQALSSGTASVAPALRPNWMSPLAWAS